MEGLRGLTWLLVFQSLGELFSRGLHLPLPGPVLGLILILVALRWSRLRHSVRVCSEFLLEHLSLLFVPVGVGVITHLALLQEFAFRIAFVILLSTWIGLGVTAVVMQRLLPDRPREGEP